MSFIELFDTVYDTKYNDNTLYRRCSNETKH